MPNTPAQFPNFDLPGAEWFGLAPNANIAIQGRRRALLQIPLTNIQQFGGMPIPGPPGTTGFIGIMSGQMQIESNFADTAGIYIHRAWLYVGDQQPGNVQVVSSILALNDSSAVPSSLAYPITLAGGLQTTPMGPLLLIDGRDILVTAKDLRAASADANIGGAPGNVINLSVYVGWASTGTVGEYWASAGIIYTRLDGLTE